MENFPVTAKDMIEISTLNSNSATSLFVTIVQKNLKGEITYSRNLITPLTTRALQSDKLQLVGGSLISVDVRSSGTALKRGECYAIINLSHGSVISNDQSVCLAAGYITHPTALNFPMSGIEAPELGPGFILSVTSADPAAGNEITHTVPSGAIWKLMSWQASLVTNSTVANRSSNLVITNGTITKIQHFSGKTMPASSTSLIRFFGGVGTDFIDSNPHTSWLSDLRLPEGYTIDTTTSNLQAGDNWGAAEMVVEEWLTT